MSSISLIIRRIRFTIFLVRFDASLRYSRRSLCITYLSGCKLVCPVGECEIECGVIAAKRHIHLTPEAAAEFGVTDKQIVSVKVGENTGRATTLVMLL